MLAARITLAHFSVQPRLHLGIGEASVDLLVELVDDLRRRGLRCTDAEPTARLVAGTL